MNIYGYFNENINPHVVEINECETLTDEIVKSALTFIGNAIKWDSGAYRPVADALHKRLLNDIYKAEYEVEYEKRYQEPTSNNSYEYGNEIAHREADRLACKLVDKLKVENLERLYNILKGYRQ